MPSVPGRFRVLPISFLCFAAAACAAMTMGTNAAGKERMEAMLNAELMTGNDAATIEGFFQRHGIAYTYDASIRRYFGSVTMGENAPLSVYVYTDTDKKMTVTLVQASMPQPVMRRPRRAQDYLDIPGATAPRPVR